MRTLIAFLGSMVILTTSPVSSQSASAPASSAQSHATSSTQPSARSRDRLLREVRHELVMLPYYGVFDNLAYRVDGDTVTLMGQVTRPTLKDDAERVVKSIEGVE